MKTQNTNGIKTPGTPEQGVQVPEGSGVTPRDLIKVPKSVIEELVGFINTATAIDTFAAPEFIVIGFLKSIALTRPKVESDEYGIYVPVLFKGAKHSLSIMYNSEVGYHYYLIPIDENTPSKKLRAWPPQIEVVE